MKQSLNHHLSLFVLILLSIVIINSKTCKSNSKNEINSVTQHQNELEKASTFSNSLTKSSKNLNANLNNAESQKKIFSEKDAKIYAKFAKMVICAKKPLKKKCKKCLKTTDGYKMFFFFEYKKSKKISYKFFIHYNDKLKKILISFGAPSITTNHIYFKKIYSRGLVLYKLYKIRIEKEFRNIYFKKLRKILHKKVKKILKSGRKGHQFVFTGYSLGASMAVLGAFDLTKSKKLSKKTNNPTVYSYGGLRIGDTKFIHAVNKSITLWKIVKQNDFVVRTPNCFYHKFSGTWRCYTTNVLRKIIYTRRFPLRRYYIRYIRPIYYRRRKLLLLRRQQQKSFLEGNSEIKSLVNEKNSKIKIEGKEKESELESLKEKNTKTSFGEQLKEKSTAKKSKMKTVSRKKLQLETNNKAKSTSNSTNHKSENMNSRVRFVRRIYRRPIMRLNRRVFVRRTYKVPTVRRGLFNFKYYFRYIYYSQPLGIQIFYNPTMTSFTVCKYIHGVSSCELKLKLPAKFSSSSHKTYYGIDFSKC